MAPGMATAAEFTIPNTNFTVDVPGVENIPGAQEFLNNAPAPAPQANNPVQVAQNAVSSKGQQIVDAARSAVGSPYAWGAAGPSSFDCSAAPEQAGHKGSCPDVSVPGTECWAPPEIGSSPVSSGPLFPDHLG